ncbi:hypothetical protein V3C99_016217, partial [Haemonchus contortus]
NEYSLSFGYHNRIMTVATLIGHAITAAVAILLTSGIWLTIYFVGVKPASKGGDTYNIYGNCSTSGDAPSSSCTPPPPVTCEKTCEFVICESIPAGLVFNSSYPIYNSTTSCWMRLMIEFITPFYIFSLFQHSIHYTSLPRALHKVKKFHMKQLAISLSAVITGHC